MQVMVERNTALVDGRRKAIVPSAPTLRRLQGSIVVCVFDVPWHIRDRRILECKGLLRTELRSSTLLQSATIVFTADGVRGRELQKHVTNPDDGCDRCPINERKKSQAAAAERSAKKRSMLQNKKDRDREELNAYQVIRCWFTKQLYVGASVSGSRTSAGPVLESFGVTCNPSANNAMCLKQPD